MPELYSMLTFVGASLLLSMAPGPDNIFVLTQSMIHGARIGFMVILGLCTGLMVHTLAVALGVSVLFQQSLLAFTVFKCLGAAYLSYLAWKAFSSFRSNDEGVDLTALPAIQGRRLYLRGIIMNLTNPKVALFFLAFLPQFTTPERGPLMGQLLILGGLFILSALFVFGGIALLAGRVGHWLSRSAGAKKWLNAISGSIFLALGLKLLLAKR